MILKTDGIEGITITGGEPFLQAKALIKLVECIKNKKDFGVIIYTGFTLKQLNNKRDNHINKLLSLSDIVIDGLYVESLNDGSSLRGSSNQKITRFTSRYDDVFDRYYNVASREIEVHLQNKNALIVGIPKINTLNQLKHHLHLNCV